MDGEGAVLSGPGVLTFRLPSPPPSMNALYGIHYGKRQVFMKPEVRAYKTTMKLYVPKWDVAESDKVELEIEVVDDWFFKNGKFKRADVQNTVKVLIDLISERQGWNDCNVWSMKVTKTHNDKQRFVMVTERKIGHER